MIWKGQREGFDLVWVFHLPAAAAQPRRGVTYRGARAIYKQGAPCAAEKGRVFFGSEFEMDLLCLHTQGTDGERPDIERLLPFFFSRKTWRADQTEAMHCLGALPQLAARSHSALGVG